jgi:hypothetical protein
VSACKIVARCGQLAQACAAIKVLDDGIRLVGANRLTACTLDFLQGAPTKRG